MMPNNEQPERRNTRLTMTPPLITPLLHHANTPARLNPLIFFLAMLTNSTHLTNFWRAAGAGAVLVSAFQYFSFQLFEIRYRSLRKATEGYGSLQKVKIGYPASNSFLMKTCFCQE